jgi:hypothetical protein
MHFQSKLINHFIWQVMFLEYYESILEYSFYRSAFPNSFKHEKTRLQLENIIKNMFMR